LAGLPLSQQGDNANNLFVTFGAHWFSDSLPELASQATNKSFISLGMRATMKERFLASYHSGENDMMNSRYLFTQLWSTLNTS